MKTPELFMTRFFSIAYMMLLLTVSGFSFAAGDAKHYPGVIIGMTNAEGETENTIGFEYEYKFTSSFGLGAVWERTPKGHGGDGVNVAVASLFYHPNKEWRLGVGVGEERIGGKKVKYKDLTRLSVTYEFMTENFILAPEVAVDFIEGEQATFLGVAVLFPF